jgi:hypothetical protein
MPADPAPGDPLSPSVPLWRQIHDRFARQIESGALAPGDPLPTTTELARQFGVTVNTVQQGLDALRRRGLIERQRGHGTFVSPKACARTLGLVFGRPALTGSDDRFYLLLAGHLGRQARQRGWELRTYLPLDDGDHDRVASEIRLDAERGRLRGLAYISEGPAMDRWLAAQAPVPVAPMHTAFDYAGLVRQAVARLAAGGARRIALVPPDRFHLERCRAACAEALATAAAGDAGELPPCNREADGLALGARLAALPADQRPQALVVCNDNAARGLIAALLAAGVAIPRDLRLATHANRGLPVFPGLAVTRLEFDPAQAADAILDALLARIAGDQPAPPLLTATLVPGDTG